MGQPQDNPPPYTPVDPAATGSSTNSTAPNSQRPPAPSPQAQPSQWRPPPTSTRPQNDYSHLRYDQGPNLPWKYPRGYHCSKCNNTGYKIKNGKSCKKCWETFARQSNVQIQYTPTYDPGMRIPFTDYRFHDDFTVTNGYKPPPMVPMQPMPMAPMMAPPQPMPYGMMIPPPPGPRLVRPGDPSLGGYTCGRCRGTGRVTFMLLDEDLCPVCHGVGRVFKT